jgi:hypothetical protein
MAKIPVFTSFDGDHDDDLRVLFIGQAKHPDTPADFADWSVKEESETWEADARARIKRCDQVAVLCGDYTHTATGVSKEIRIAREEGIPYFLIKGRKDKTCTRPTAALPSDKMYKWTWDNVKSLVSGKR